MSTILFEQQVRTAGASEGVGCLGAGALIALVVLCVNGTLLLTAASMTPTLEVAVNYSTPLMALLAIGLGITWHRAAKGTARRLQLVREGEDLRLTVEPGFEEAGPFTLLFGWYRVPGGRGMKHLWCDVYRGETFVVRLSHSLGRGPVDWPDGMPSQARSSEHGGYVVARLEELVTLLRRNGAVIP